MSTQNRSSGGGRNQKKSNSGSGGGGGDSSATQASNNKKTDASKTEKEKIHTKPTAEQLRIAQITNSNASEDPQMREKVATLIEMTQRSEEEVCCALNECDNNLERAVVFLLETLPVGAFETSSKKKKNKAATTGKDGAGGGDGDDWGAADSNANTDKREKSRQRSSNRGGRGGTDSRGWRGREARENDRNNSGGGENRNMRESRGERGNDNRGGGGGGGGFGSDYRSGGPRGAGGRMSGGRGGGYVGRGGRGGGRMGGGDRRGGGGSFGGTFSTRQNANEDHHEVELWDNNIAQTASISGSSDKQASSAQQHGSSTQDDAWGDWDNEEYVGSLKEGKIFTPSNLQQTTASVVSGGGGAASELSAPPGLEHHHLGTAGQPQGSHLNALLASGTAVLDDSVASVVSSVSGSATTPMMQYSAAVSQSQSAVAPNAAGSSLSHSAITLNATQYNSGASAAAAVADTFSNAATAAANLVQQVQQQQQQQQQQQSQSPPQSKSSATLSAEQSQYFNSLTSQGGVVAGVPGVTAAGVQQQQQQLAAAAAAATYAQNAASAVQYPTSYANVFGTSAAAGVSSGVVTAGTGTAGTVGVADQAQLTNVVGAAGQQPQVRRARAKLPPPSKIPSTAVEMPSDTLNNTGYLDVQFGGLDFGTDDSFDTLPEKFNASVSIDGQQQQQQQQQQQAQLVQSQQAQLVQSQQAQLVQSQQDAVNDYNQSKASVQQQQQSAISAGLQNSQIGGDSLPSGYAQRSATQHQQQQVISNVGGSNSSPGGSALDQLTKNDPYSQSNASNSSGYQSSYQTNSAAAAATNKVYQQSAAAQGYNSSSYANVQSSVANSYQPQSYASYQQNSVNSYQQQQQQAGSGQNVSNSVGGGSNVSGSSTQNIPVGGSSNSNNSATVNSNAGYLSSGYPSQQSAYQTSQSVYGSTGLSNNTGFAGSTNTSSSQYSNFSTSAKLKDTSAASSTSHFESVSSSGSAANQNVAGQSAVSSVGSNAVNSSSTANNNSMSSSSHPTHSFVGVSALTNSNVTNSSAANNANVNANVASSVSGNSSGGGVGQNANQGSSSGGSQNAASSMVTAAAVSASSSSSSAAAAAAAAANKNSASGGGAGMVPNIQMVSQYIQTGLPYYQQPVYSYEDLQMMQQRVPHVQGYYDLNYTPTSLGAGRDNLGSVAYSTMTDARFARTDNNSSPVSNVSSTMSQQTAGSGPMLNVPYAYFYGGMPGGFQYGTPAIYPQQIPAANTASGGQFPKPSYNTGYGSTNYDTLSQASQDYTKGAYPSSVNQQTKSQNVTNPPQAGTGSDITSSMYGKGHVALNKVNSYEKQSYHSGTPPPFNMPNTQTAGGTSAQPYGMYVPMSAAGHHNMIHQPIHQDSNSTGQRQQTSSQSKAATKQGYSPSYWTGQN